MGEIITAGGLTTLILEGIKILWRKFIAKDMSYDFPVAFYTISIPLLNALMPFVIFWLGFTVESPVLGMTLIELVRYLLGILLGSLVSLVGYTAGVKPLKEYSRELEG